MKLIIEIDDEMVCNDIKSKALEPTSTTDEVIINALYNGIPYKERPQGEWIRYRDNPHQPEHIKCSNCGQYWSIADHDKIFDICFKCGAEMRKGGAE